MNLYHKLKDSEELNEDLSHVRNTIYKLLEDFNGLPGFGGLSNNTHKKLSYKICIPEVQVNLIKEYEGNPILNDAVKGKQTIEDTVNELGEINKGIKKILPRRKNKVHNERVKQLGDLVPYTGDLLSRGISYPDNFLTTTIEAFPIIFGFCSLASIGDFQPIGSTIIGGVFSPIIGAVFNSNRFGSLPTKEAKYVDEKIKELNNFYLDLKK